MPNKYNKPGLRSTEDQNGGHGVILCDVGPEDQGLPGRVHLKFDFLGLHIFLPFDLHLIFACVACKIQVQNTLGPWFLRISVVRFSFVRIFKK